MLILVGGRFTPEENVIAQKVNYEATSSSWINLGIAGLFRFLDRHDGEFNGIRGDSESLTLEIRGEPEDAIPDFLDRAVQLLYMEETGNQGYFYSPESEEVKAYPKKNFGGISRYYWGKVQQRFESKIDLGEIKDRGVEVPEGAGGQRMGTSPPRVSIKHRLNLEENKRTPSCAFCGSERRTWKIRKLEYPMGSSPGRFLNFKPYLKGDERICAPCSWASIFAMDEAITNMAWVGGSAHHVTIIPDPPDLEELYQLQNVIKTPTDRISDPEKYFGGTWIKGGYEFLLHFLIRLEENLRRIEEEEKSPDLEELSLADLITEKAETVPIPRSVLVVEGIEDRFSSMIPYSKNHEMIRIIHEINNTLIEERKTSMKALFDRLPVIQGENKILPHRNELSKMMLRFQPLINQMKRISDEKDFIYGALTFLREYQTEVCGMEASMIDQLYGIGRKIGRYCREHDYRRPILNLRNVNNHPQLVRVLRKIQFDIPEIYTHEDLIKRIHEERADHVANLIALAANQTMNREVEEE